MPFPNATMAVIHVIYHPEHNTRRGDMAVGTSGRVVVEIDPDLKRALHAALRLDGLSMKDWFLTSAHTYLEARQQPELKFEVDDNGKQKREAR